MLRSIIAIWTLALALLVVAATAGCELNGCANGASCSDGIPVPDMSRAPDLIDYCPMECGSCDGSTEICFQGSVAASLPSLCARPCNDDRNCASGEKCATLFAAMQPSICISAGKPRGCGSPTPNWHCDLAAAACKDSVTAQVAFSDAADQVCGWEIVHCPNGCANGACL